MIPPQKIFFHSDQTEAELVMHAGKVKGDEVYYYRYTKSIMKLPEPFPMSMIQIERLKSMNLLTVE